MKKIGALQRNMIHMENGNKYKLLFSKVASKDKLKLKNCGLDKNCRKILDLMIVNPFGYSPPYEKLTGELTGYYSRRINRQHRIIYSVIEETKEIHIIRMLTHYE